MKNVWPWIFGIAVGLIIATMLFAGASNRQILLGRQGKCSQGNPGDAC